MTSVECITEQPSVCNSTSSDADYEQLKENTLNEMLADLHECSSGIRFYFEAADEKILGVEQSLQRSRVTTEAWFSLNLSDNYRVGWSNVDGAWGLYLCHQDPEDPDPLLPILKASCASGKRAYEHFFVPKRSDDGPDSRVHKCPGADSWAGNAPERVGGS